MRSFFMPMLMVVALAQMAVATDRTWEGGNGGSWHTTNNWDPPGTPSANDVLTIDDGWAEIDNSAIAYCKRLVIDDSDSGVSILAGATLVLGDGSARTSTVDGNTNYIKIAGTLEIDGLHTIAGSGEIELTDNYTSLINEANDGDDQLILETECGASPIEQACSMTLIGQGVVNVALDNRAFVVANHGHFFNEEGLHLATRQKTTDDEAEGYWMAILDGMLWVETLVTGPGEWHVTDGECDDGDATIIVGREDIETDGCVASTGRVLLMDGCGGLHHTLKVYEHAFCTTGKLVWESIDDGEGNWSRPAIKVVEGAAASFGLSEECDPVNICGGS